MPVIGTYQGASIITLPDNPGFRNVEWVLQDTVAVQRSPFTGVSQVQGWPGADWWEASITLPQMNAVSAASWSAFLAECRGMTNVFYLGDPLRTQPMGSADGVPVANGATNAMSTTVATRGWTANTSFLLLPGDQLQIGQRLHVVTESVMSDGNGNASIPIWPSLREATTDGQQIVLNQPQGLFRLADNKRSLLTAETRLTCTSIHVVEAR